MRWYGEGAEGAEGVEGACVPDDDTLILCVDQHVSVHVVGQGVDVGRVLILGLWARDTKCRHSSVTIVSAKATPSQDLYCKTRENMFPDCGYL